MRKHAVLIIITLVVLAFGASMAFGFPAVEVYQKTSKSVMLIVGITGDDNIVGAGSLVTNRGHIVTNAHVVIDKATNRPFSKIWVFVKPEEVTGDMEHDLVNRYKARVIAYDKDLDLALIRAPELPSNITTVPLADPREIMVGEEVVAIGHPEQGGLWSLTYGRISGQIANQNEIAGKDVYQTDTSVNRGNSGGPLLDRRGYMVGVNTNIARVGAGNLPITGVNFALKSAVVKKWLAKEGYTLAYGVEALSPAAPIPAKQDVSEQEPARTETEKTEAEPEPEPQKMEPEPEPRKAEPEPQKVEPEPEPQKTVPEPRMAEKIEEPELGEELESDTLLTPKRPFTQDDLLSEVEKELEDMMDEMRMKIRH